MDVVTDLARAIHDYDDWPDGSTKYGAETLAERGYAVIDAARRLIGVIEMRADLIRHLRETTSPTEQAIAEILGRAGE